MTIETVHYQISPEIPEDQIGNLYEFIYKELLLANKDRFVHIERATAADKLSLAYWVIGAEGNAELSVEITGGKKVTVSIIPLAEGVSQDEIQKAREDVVVAVDAFEEQVRKNSLFFAWRQGESVVPEHVSGKGERSSRTLFETQILMTMILMAVQLVLFYFVGVYFGIIVLAIQAVFMFYSNKIVAKIADWQLTQKNPFVHILEYSLSSEGKEAVDKLPRKQLSNLKKEVYDEAIAGHGEVDRQKCKEIFSKYGIECKVEDFTGHKVNAYELVEETAEKFGFPMPEVVVSNTLAPNAAASGPSPSRGVVTMTSGLFVQLDDDEIKSVLGHEFGHLKGHDPLILFGLSSAEFLFRFYVLFPLVPLIFINPILFLLYLGAVMGVIYTVAKFLEERADLVSAMVIGQPNVLADALEKIGYQRLLLERKSSFRVQEWLSTDSHPPIYFRIQRLRNLKTPFATPHPLLDSARACMAGFRQSVSVIEN